MFDALLKDFALRIGLEELSFSSRGVAQVDIADTGMVYFEKQLQADQEELLVYMAKKFNAYDTEFPQKLLEFCSYENAHFPPVYGSISGDSCILGLRFSQGQLYSGTELENSIYYLQSLFERLMDF